MNQSTGTAAIFDGLLLVGVIASGAVMVWDNHTEEIDPLQPDGSRITTTRAEMGTSIVCRFIGLLERTHQLKSRLGAMSDFFTARSFG